MRSGVLLKSIFYSLVVIFILLMFYFIIPSPYPIRRRLFVVVMVLSGIFLILGILLIVIARKEKGTLKFFLTLTGIAASVPLIFTLLHNLFYALSITLGELKSLFEVLHVSSFIISIIVAPIMFIIGATGSIVLFNRMGN